MAVLHRLAYDEERIKNSQLMDVRTKERLANEKFVQQFELELLKNVQHRSRIMSLHEVSALTNIQYKLN